MRSEANTASVGGAWFARACGVAWIAFVHIAFSAAAPPIAPLPAPFYSFDLASPAVDNGFVNAADVLILNQPFPVALIAGAAMGLSDVDDELDGLSSANALVSPTATFVLLFSVSRDTTGNVGPDPILVGLGIPYNVADQAARGQQAGDEFMSTMLYSRTGGPLLGPPNSAMGRNNYDEGGSDLAARPETSAQTVTAEDQDNVDALAGISVGAGPYFSVSADSPSRFTLPGLSSGADIFRYDPVLMLTTLYASHDDLGLEAGDDVDAVIVFDTDTDGDFDGADQVLFSLAPGSPSLVTIAGASATGAAADVFLAEPGVAPTIFAPAASLGLGAVDDDIDALDLSPCSDATGCARHHGIRLVEGDFDDDGDVDAPDREAFEDCYRGEGQPYDPGCSPGDFDEDSDVGCSDWAAFTQAWTEGGSPDPISPCAAAFIPTVSAWGLTATALCLLIAGTVVLRSREPRDAPSSA